MFNAFIYKLFSVFTAVVCFFSNLIGLPAAEKVEAEQYPIDGEGSSYVGDGRLCVHDPSVIQDSDGQFYVFGSHGCAGKTSDLKNWENVANGVHDNNRMLVPEGSTLREVLSEPLAWTDTFQQLHNYDKSAWETGVWAADVVYNEAMEKYCYYACSSVWGTVNSVIWFGTSDSIDGPYENIKCIVYSGFDSITRGPVVPKYPTHYSFTNIGTLLEDGTFSLRQVRNADWFDENGYYDNRNFPNAIDPTVFYDKNGELWMVYGSYSGGVYIIPLVEDTGEPDYKYMKNTDGYDFYYGKRLSRTNEFTEWTGEGPYITYDPVSDYYYLYISYGGLHSLGGYNIREYRSKNVDGPYLDAAGNDALDSINSGVKLFGNYKFDCLDVAYLAGGHSSGVVADDGKMFHVYHTRFNYGNEWHQVRTHQMARTQNGWATVLPFEYTGETIDYSGFDKSLLVGEYEFINHGNITNGCDDWSGVEDIISPTQSITLNADGTVSGLRVYESVKQNTAVSSREANGTWSVTDGTAYISFNIDGVGYEGVFCTQTEENTGAEKIVFSAIGSNNESLWGVMK